MYEKESGCNFCTLVVVDFVSHGVCYNTRFFKEVAFTEVHFTPLYWPNIRGNLNRPVLQKVPFCHKCARVVKGMNAR